MRITKRDGYDGRVRSKNDTQLVGLLDVCQTVDIRELLASFPLIQRLSDVSAIQNTTSAKSPSFVLLRSKDFPWAPQLAPIDNNSL